MTPVASTSEKSEEKIGADVPDDDDVVFLDPDDVVVEDGKETDETFFWKVCVLCEAHMRRSNARRE